MCGGDEVVAVGSGRLFGLALSSSLLNDQSYYRLGSVQVIDRP
jgi:hypothetical protein